jgi:5-hydroxyisourate hydrolase
MQTNTQRRVEILAAQVTSSTLIPSKKMSQHSISISSHVLDQNNGRTAPGIKVTLDKWDGSQFVRIAEGVTNQDGRVTKDAWKWNSENVAGNSDIYQAVFQSGEYYAQKQIETLYPFVPIVFKMSPQGGHYHIPLLLSPFGYSTYRGS